MVSKVNSPELANYSSTFASHSSVVALKREKRANLRKHVRRICSLNSTMHEKIRQYLVILFSWLKFLQFASKIFNQPFNAGETVNRNPRLDQRFFRAVQRLTQSAHGCDATVSNRDLNITCITNCLSSNYNKVIQKVSFTFPG